MSKETYKIALSLSDIPLSSLVMALIINCKNNKKDDLIKLFPEIAIELDKRNRTFDGSIETEDHELTKEQCKNLLSWLEYRGNAYEAERLRRYMENLENYKEMRENS